MDQEGTGQEETADTETMEMALQASRNTPPSPQRKSHWSGTLNDSQSDVLETNEEQPVR